MAITPERFSAAVNDALEIVFTHARNALGPDASIADLAKWVVEKQSEEARCKYAATKNPVYIWQLLSRLTNLSEHAARLDPSLSGVPYPGGLPVWVQRYLQETAWNLSQLAQGFDYRSPEARVPRWWCEIGGLGPAKAGELMGQALGFSRRGWSAIADYQNDAEAELIADYMWTDELSGSGPGAAHYIELFQEAKGLADERDARRRIAKVRNRRPNRGRVVTPKSSPGKS